MVDVSNCKLIKTRRGRPRWLHALHRVGPAHNHTNSGVHLGKLCTSIQFPSVYMKIWRRRISKLLTEWQRCLEQPCTVVSGPIWTNLVQNWNVIFFFKTASYGQIRASRYKLMFMATLQVRTQWNYQSWIQIFQIKFLFLVLSFWKRIALVYFLKRIEAICFWKSKIQIKTLIWKKVLKWLKFGLSWGKNGRYALCDAFYTCF